MVKSTFDSSGSFDFIIALIIYHVKLRKACISTMVLKICQVLNFLCEIKLDIPINVSKMSITQGGLMSFDECQQGCKAKKAKMINKEYFEYLLTVSN